jgi:hypothetical protein
VSAMPPPGTIMCTCGWWVIAEPQLRSTAVMPRRAPRCFASAAIVSMASEAARNNRSRPPGINSSVSALGFFFTVTHDLPDLSRRLAIVHAQRKLPLARLLEAAPGPKYKAALGTAYGAGLQALIGFLRDPDLAFSICRFLRAATFTGRPRDVVKELARRPPPPAHSSCRYALGTFLPWGSCKSFDALRMSSARHANASA